MTGLLIFLCIIAALSLVFSFTAFAKAPSSKLRIQLMEICELLREIADTLKEIRNNMGAKADSSVKSVVESPEFQEKIQESVQRAFHMKKLEDSIIFEPTDDIYSIEEIVEVPVAEPEPPAAQELSHEENEKAIEQEFDVQEYGDHFFYDNYGPNKRANGRSILVSDSNRDFLRVMTERSGVDNITMAAYLDNIIRDHIGRYGDEILGVFDGKYSPDKLNNANL